MGLRIVSEQMGELYQCWFMYHELLPEMPSLALPTFIGAYVTDGCRVWYEGGASASS